MICKHCGGHVVWEYPIHKAISKCVQCERKNCEQTSTDEEYEKEQEQQGRTIEYE
jgi:hypothetical protein